MATTPKPFFNLNTRVFALKIVLALAFLLLFGRAGYLLVVAGPELRGYATDQSLIEKQLIPHRGAILDRNGKVLAQSVEACRIDIRPKSIPDDQKEAVSAKLAEILQLPVDGILQKLREFEVPFPLLRQIDVEVGQRVREANLDGVDVHPTEKRVYPYGAIAGQVLGFVHPDFNPTSGREELFGLEGIEAAYERKLHGQSGNAVYLVGPTGEQLPVDPLQYTPAVNGETIVLTIDSVIQNITEAALEKAATEKNAKSASAVVLDSRSGDILAMASYPDFDPNQWSLATEEQFKNNATQFVYEPGSVFKFVVGAAALEEGVIQPSTIISDDGPIEIGGYSFSCPSDFGGPHGAQDLFQLFKNSCNVGFIQMGQMLGSDRLRQYMDLFGFGRPDNLELPLASGDLPAAGNWYDVLLATASFGYGFYATPLQVASAFQVVANDGRYISPHLIKEIRKEEGKPGQAIHLDSTRQVISQKTAIQLREALKGVVETQTPAEIKNYGVVGKTGTARVYQGGEATDLNNTTFVGALPADDPQVVIMININEPQVEFAYAVRVCVPAFMEIASKLVDILRIPPP